jgi:hypothetical protein
MEMITCSGFQRDELQTDFQDRKKKKDFKFQQDRQCEHNVIFRRVRTTIVAAKQQ